MANYNKVFLMGNLTRDPEVRVTPNGLTIAKLGLAVNRRYRTKDGEQKEETTFVDIDAFGAQAEVIQKYCQKGRPLFVEGRLKLDQWQDKNTNENRSKLGIVLENFQFLGSRGDNQGGDSNPYEKQSPPAQSNPPSKPSSDNFEEDDDVPF